MNLLLQDPFQVLKEYPERLTHTIQNPLQSTCIKYSIKGDYMAIGCSNGAILVYDMDTMRPVGMLDSDMGGAHIRAVQSLNWGGEDGRYIISSSRDWTIKVWDLSIPGKPIRHISFDGPIWGAQFVRKENIDLCIATVFEESTAFLIDFSSDKSKITPLVGIEEDHIDCGYVLTAIPHPLDPDVIITGSTKGWVKFYKLGENNEITLLHSERMANSNIKHVVISANGDKIAVNSSDRTVRQYALKLDDESKTVILDLEHKYQDVINKLQWNSIVFSNKSADYLVASTHGSSTHEIYIWETNSGTLVRVLEGAEEELMDIDWNFYRMSIASNGYETGDVYIWSIVIPPKWSALAPDFEEIEENIEYREKEDEFDQVDLIGQQELTQAEEKPIDLRASEQYDVRGNDLTVKQCTFATDYQRIIMMKQDMTNKY